MFSVIMPLCNRIFCCILGWYFYVKSGWKKSKLNQNISFQNWLFSRNLLKLDPCPWNLNTEVILMYTNSSSVALYVTMLILPPKHFDIHLAKSQFLDMFVTCYIDEYSLILWLPYCHRHTPFSQRLSTYSALNYPSFSLSNA